MTHPVFPLQPLSFARSSAARRSVGALLLACAIAAGSASAADAGSVTTHVRVTRADIDPSSPRAVRHLMQRISDAALEACGGSSFSLAEAKAAVQASSCWHDAYSDAVARSGLSQPQKMARSTGSPVAAD